MIQDDHGTLDIQKVVRERYGQAARLVLESRAKASCCSGGTDACCGSSSKSDPITSGLYSSQEARELPEEALLASLGCGNPTALAELKPGEIVLDLGSGGGVDVLLAAQRIAPDGMAYGVDMTDEMLELAERNRAKAGIQNACFLKGTMEHIPFPDRSIDVILSNCVINLSADKPRVFREAYRVLKPGGRLAVSDLVWRRSVPEDLRRNADLWAGCIAGALLEDELRVGLAQAGFVDVTVTPTRAYTLEDMRASQGEACSALSVNDLKTLDGALVSAFIRARKPAR